MKHNYLTLQNVAHVFRIHNEYNTPHNLDKNDLIKK